MLSKITIEVDFANNNTPAIRLLVRSSDDIRDKLLEKFINQLPSQSAWCKIQFISGMPETSVSYDAQQYLISPVKVDDLFTEAQLMLSWHHTIYGNIKNPASNDELVSMDVRDNEGKLQAVNVFKGGVLAHKFVVSQGEVAQ